MSDVLSLAITATLILYAAAMGLGMARLFRGPSAQDRVLADALKTLHRDMLTEPVPPSLLAAAKVAAEVHERTTAWWRWGGMAASVILAFGLGWTVHGQWPSQGGSRSTVASQTPEIRFATQAQIAHAVYSPEVKHPVEVAAEQQDHLV